MTKRDFDKVVKNQLKELPLEDQEEILKDFKNGWLREIWSDFHEKHMDKKKEFKEFIEDSLGQLSEEQIKKNYDKIKEQWLPEIEKTFKDKVRFKYKKCPRCGKYSLTRSFKYIRREELKNSVDLTSYWLDYSDHVFADVLYDMYYIVCPCCGFEIEDFRIEKKISNKHDRYGNPI